MNRKKRSDLKTKTIMIASFMKIIVLTLAILGMMTVAAYAGAFLSEGSDTFSVDIEGATYSGYNRGETTFDNWADEWDSEPLSNTNLSQSDFDDEGIGYYTANTSSYYGYTGFYIGTFDVNRNGNDIEPTLLTLLEYFLNSPISNYTYVKAENTDTTATDTNGSLTLNIDYDSGNESGSWEVRNSENNLETINFYSVMGGGEYALYYVDPAEASGIWTTRHVTAGQSDNSPTISHFSLVKYTDTPPPGDTGQVPEPATMLLFGFSLMGLAGVARRKNSKF